MMEFLNEHWLVIVIAMAIVFIAHMMGRSDGVASADKRDGTLRHDSDGWVWVYDDGKWIQLMHRPSPCLQGHPYTPVKIENLSMTVTQFSRPEELNLPKERIEE